MDSDLVFTVRRFSGKVGDTQRSWSSTYTYKPPEGLLLEARGSIFVVIDITSSSSMDLQLAGKLVFDAVVERYYAETEGSPLNSLEQAIVAGKERLVDLSLDSHSPIKSPELDFNIAAVVIWGTIVYLARLGNVATVLIRDGKAEEVGGGYEGTVTTASGVVKLNDTFILGSSAFRNAVSLTKLIPYLPVLKNAAEELGVETIDRSKEILVKNAYPSDFSVILFEFLLPAEAGAELAKEESLVDEDAKVDEASGAKAVTVQRLKRKPRPLMVRRLTLLGEKLKRLGKKLKPSPPPIYIKREQAQLPPYSGQNSRMFILGIGLLISVFVFSVYFTISKKRSRAHGEQVIELLEKADADVTKAKELIDLNNSRAREFLRGAQESLEEAVSLSNGVTGDIQGVQKEISEVLDTVNKVVRITEPDLYYDLQIQDKGTQPTALSGGNDSLYIADPGTEAVYRLRIVEGEVPSIEKVSSDSLAGVQVVLSGAGRLFVVGERGLSILDLEDGSVTKSDFTIPVSWDLIESADLYVDGLYFLSKDNNQIYRTFVEGNSFSEAVGWVGDQVNFADAEALTIDGDVYILKSTSGEVLKMSGGVAADWKIRELDIPLSNPQVLFSTVDSNFLFIGDNGNKRIIMVTKEGGLYNRQFVYEGGKENVWVNMKGLWADERESTIYLLDGTKIYKVEY